YSEYTGTGPRPGMLARVASQRYDLLVAHAKSPAVSATKRQTSRSPAAVARPAPISLRPTIERVASDSSTCDNRSRVVVLNTASGFCSTPVAPTIQPAGTSRLTSQRPKLL